MPFVEGRCRDQIRMASMDSQVADESLVRIIDVFVDSLDLAELGFGHALDSGEGRPAYDAGSLLKLYIYGHHEGIRSSRKLARACEVNLEVIWLMRGLRPDFRTISRFRKDSAQKMKSVFASFTKKVFSVLETGFVSVDGSKFQACCGKDQNFTATKLDDRLQWLAKHMEEYARLLDREDAKEDSASEESPAYSKEELERRLAEAKERYELYESYRDYMEAHGLAQLSLTDPDAKLMKNKNGFAVAYNVQTAVDSETHIIRDYETTNRATDHGLLKRTLARIRTDCPERIINVVADKGYQSPKDMVDCLENGIIPNVILPEGRDSYTLEIDYEEKEITEDMLADASSESLRACLHAGEIPKAYEGILTAAVIEKKQQVANESDADSSGRKTIEEAKDRAAEGYFVRDPERNIVVCPQGEILRQKSLRRNGEIRYANKAACHRCPHRHKCITGKQDWREIDFNKDTLEKPNRAWLKAENKQIPLVSANRTAINRRYEKKKKVQLTLCPDRPKMAQRMCLSEHPFGTVKRAMNGGYFLLRGLKQVDGEIALTFLGYNLTRAKNILGFHRLKDAVS